jgi:thiamine pyrophosphokinase
MEQVSRLDLPENCNPSGLDSDEEKVILSEGGGAMAPSKEEKSFFTDRTKSEGCKVSGKSSKAWVFLNGDLGDINFVKKLINKNDLIVACDGGMNTLERLGIKPNAIVGDFDSFINQTKQIAGIKPDDNPAEVIENGISYLKYPTEKDFLDSELAIDFAVSKGFKAINLVNVIGSEIDHMLGTIFLLDKPKYHEIDLKILTSNQTIFIADGDFTISGDIGKKVSLIPLFSEVKVASSSGLKYNPANYQMHMQTNSGISNEFTAKQVKVSLKYGKFLVVIHR